MQLFIIVLFFCFIIFLFCLYFIGKDDYVLLRKNINLEILFNIAFTSIVGGLFFSRLFYVLFHLKKIYLNPLVFFAFPYFPGLSLGGGIIGGIVCLYLLTKSKRLPFWRILDLLALSLLAAIPYGMLGGLFLNMLTVYSASFMAVVYLSLFIFFFKFLHPKLMKGALKEGRIGLYFFLCYGAFALLLSIISHKKGLFYFFGLEDILSVFIFITSFILFIRLERNQKKNGR